MQIVINNVTNSLSYLILSPQQIIQELSYLENIIGTFSAKVVLAG